jgi:glycosyltransferase involved in cell wall biosynthesis
MNILFAIHVSRDGLTAVYKNTRERAAFLETQGHSCVIVTPDDFPWIKRFGSRFIPILYPFALAVWLARRPGAFDVAVFHSFAGWVVTTLRDLVSSYQRLRIALMFHGLEPVHYPRFRDEMARAGTPLSLRYRLVSGSLMLRLLRASCRRADLLLCLNSGEARFLIDHQWAPRDRIRVVANPAPDDFFVSRLHREQVQRLLFVGQWLPMKGIRYLARAFTQLHRSSPKLRLCCAGTLAPAEIVLKDFPIEVHDAIEVFPRLSSAQLLALHRDSDVFIFPSISEGFSLALMEAMSSGLPIVTTPVGAAPDILEAEHSALLIPYQDSDALLSATSRLIADRGLREYLGRNAQRVAESFRHEFTWRDYLLCFEMVSRQADRMKTPDTAAAGRGA